MAGIRIVFEDGEKLGRKLEVNVKKFGERQTRAVQAVAERVKDEMEYQGRANIRAGGNFGSSRWQQGLQALISFASRVNIRIRLTHSVFYWKVFEEGAVIHGRPLLWIPLSFGNAFGVSAKDYPKPLFRVNRLGKAPLLLDDQGPQYFGKESVTIPKKWDLRGITKRISRNMGAYYKEAMKNGR